MPQLHHLPHFVMESFVVLVFFQSCASAVSLTGCCSEGLGHFLKPLSYVLNGMAAFTSHEDDHNLYSGLLKRIPWVFRLVHADAL